MRGVSTEKSRPCSIHITSAVHQLVFLLHYDGPQFLGAWHLNHAPYVFFLCLSLSLSLSFWQSIYGVIWCNIFTIHSTCVSLFLYFCPIMPVESRRYVCLHIYYICLLAAYIELQTASSIVAHVGTLCWGDEPKVHELKAMAGTIRRVTSKLLSPKNQRFHTRSIMSSDLF